MPDAVPAAFARELSSLSLPGRPPLQPVVTEADLAGLPAVVRRYFDFVGLVGHRREWSFRVASKGRFRRSKDEPWMPCAAWQYNTRIDVARVFRMGIRVGGVVPLVGHDTYLQGHGRMLIKLADVFPVGDDTGDELDIGELVTWLDDAILLAPGMLLDDRVRFTAVDDDNFDVSVTDGGRTVTARVTVDSSGAPVDVETSDRFLRGPDGTWQRARWHTPIAAWTAVDGRRVPVSGRAAWILPDGELTYVELEFLPDTLSYDVD